MNCLLVMTNTFLLFSLSFGICETDLLPLKDAFFAEMPPMGLL